MAVLSSGENRKFVHMEKVIFLEEMAAEPVETLSSVFDFLGMKLLDEEGESKVSNRKSKSSVLFTVYSLFPT